MKNDAKNAKAIAKAKAGVAAAMPRLEIRLTYNEEWLISDPVKKALQEADHAEESEEEKDEEDE